VAVGLYTSKIVAQGGRGAVGVGRGRIGLQNPTQGSFYVSLEVILLASSLYYAMELRVRERGIFRILYSINHTATCEEVQVIVFTIRSKLQ